MMSLTEYPNWIQTTTLSPNSKHGEDINNRVGTPRDYSPPLHSLNEVAYLRIAFRVGCISKSYQKFLDDVQERNDCSDPEEPTPSKVVFGQNKFSRVSNSNHKGRQ